MYMQLHIFYRPTFFIDILSTRLPILCFINIIIDITVICVAVVLLLLEHLCFVVVVALIAVVVRVLY